MPLAQTIGLETLSKYFHLPINDVAKELGVCATVLKKICRKNGIPRWPHRKIKSLDKMIMTLEVSVAKNPEDGERIRHEIHTLKNKKMFLMKNPNVLATKAPSMKKGMKPNQKGDKSPIESPESPSGMREHPHHGVPYHYAYPYGPYPDHPQYPYNLYNTTGFKGAPMPYPYYPYPYPPQYPHHPMEHRRPIEEECLSPSMVLDPVAAALFLQIPHPHMPHPAVMARVMESQIDNPQWVPSNSSAFAPNLRAKVPHPSQVHGYHPDMYIEQAHMVPQHSPPHHPHPHPPPHHSPPHHPHPPPHHSPSHGHHSPHVHSPVVHHPSSDYLIHLPELRLPDEKEKPKTLSTLEPGVATPSSPSNSNNPTNSNNTTTSSPAPSPSASPSHTSAKWPVPEWFEAEQQLLRKDIPKGYQYARRGREDSNESTVPGDHTPPLSVGE